LAEAVWKRFGFVVFSVISAVAEILRFHSCNQAKTGLFG